MPEPKPPRSIDPHARAVLDGLAAHPEAAVLVLGGAFALRHYLDYRDTHDLDAWWASGSTTSQQVGAIGAVRGILEKIADTEGLNVGERRWGDVVSLELVRPPAGRAIFSVQVAARDRFLEPPLSSAWPPLRIEGLADTLASKMTALVSRGAPRDMLDVFMAYQEQLAAMDTLWELWRARNPGQDEEQARAQVRHHLAALEARRPLAHVPTADRERAGEVRAWLRDQLAAPILESDRDR